MKNEIVGEGTYGCVIKPALKCDKRTKMNKNDYDNRLSKVMSRNDAIEELKEMQKESKGPQKSKKRTKSDKNTISLDI